MNDPATDPDARPRPEIGVGPATDLEAYVRTDDTVWFGESDPDPIELQLVSVPADQRFAAQFDGAASGTYPGIYGIRPMTLSIPGSGQQGDAVRRVPAPGLTWVSVHPDHRRQGVLTAMIAHHFDQTRANPGAQGSSKKGAVSVLHASEPAIYGRYGYGLASLEMSITLGRGSTLTAPHLDAEAAGVRTELTTVTDPGMPERLLACWQHNGCQPVGTVVGELGYFIDVCHEPVSESRGKERQRVLFARRVDSQGRSTDVGLALLRREQKWERGRPGGSLKVTWLVGDPATKLALLRRLVDFDLVDTTEVSTLGADDPVLHWVNGPRGTGDVSLYDSLWVRLIDLPRALIDRGYAATCDLVLDVADVQVPENAGRWRLHVDHSGTATVTRTEDGADLRMSIAALGSTYLGGVSPVTLTNAGLIEELRAGAARELSAAVCTPERPAAAIGF